MAETTGITDVEWLDQKVCELTAAIEQKDQIIAGLLEAAELVTGVLIRQGPTGSLLYVNANDLRALSEAASKAREAMK